ncbi:MAG: MBL fold metallo-hydrolase [Eubacteriales bacterium]|nr:MBL fold metallo-hydrolase [Eubacteriales bacterium]
MPRRMEALALSVILCAACATLPFGRDAGAETPADDARQTTVTALFLNVGKADAALFMLGNKCYLVDTGTKESADAMLRVLAFYHVTRLDGVVITHTDKDHVGGLKTLLKSDIAVGELYAPQFSVISEQEHPVAKLADKYAIPLRWLYAGDTITVDDTTKLVVLGPLTRDGENENNNSLVLRLVTPQGDMLLTGDMLVQEEGELLDAGLIQPAAVLKVSHHGADDASSEAFLYTLRPQLAVISTDPDEGASTPDPKIIRRLWNTGTEVFITHQASCCVQVTLNAGNAVGRLVNYFVE